MGPLLVRRISESGLETIDEAWHDPNKQPIDTIALYTKPLQAVNWDIGLWHYSTSPEVSDLPEKLDQLGDLPILIITGDDDRIVPTENSIALAGKIPGAELIILENCGHVPQEECPQAFLNALNTFLFRLDP
jgi:pimeloyl-ACP methyl ester carboxylesterase